ncbi:MFS transporter [Dielma fastidiosa]|uniref:Na+/melibiose symporter-like transporter n=1 Tax=Dielma fastidiosa TaxID=1034346 RepID=A0A318KLK6_9FIRM|nr:MFS transporter [Dielma fastidiosa]PXX77292.1 Na+/melibiose symporter-like transporter [Dielma fastidiosa]
MKLNNKRTILVGLAFMSICAFWQLYDNIIPLILLNTFHLKDTVSGFIMSLDNILALFMLPLFGAFSDRVNTRMGKRMPFIVFGTILAAFAMLLLPIADLMQSMLLFFTALGLTLFAMATYRSPAVALMPDITPKPLRSKANAIINLMGAVGGIITLILITLLVPKTANPNYFPLFLSIASIMLLCVAILFMTIKEKQLRIADDEAESEEASTAQHSKMEPAVKRSLMFILFSVAFWFMGYNAVTTAFSKYANVVWGMSGGEFAKPMMVATVAAIISYIPVGSLSSRFGRKKMILAGVVLLACSYLSGMFFTTFSPLLNIVFGMVGIAWAMINVNSYPMVVEMSQGSDVGKYTGTYYTFSMAAQVLTPILSGFLLEYVGYWTLFPYAALCVLIALLLFTQVKHGDNRPEKRSLLEAFDVED